MNEPYGQDTQGIVDRVRDSALLWNNGHFEGAFLMALVAVAATARKRYPMPTKDSEAFERFLASAHTVRISVEFRGELHPIEHIFYKWFRCELLHEGDLPCDINFVDQQGLFVRAGGAPEFVLQVSKAWFDHLVASVVAAPENSGLFSSNGAGG